MLSNTIKVIGAITCLAVLGSCTTGPQKQKDIDGLYVGALTGAPDATIELHVKNGTITGTGNIKAGDPLYRTGGGESDITITGTYANMFVTSMTGTISLEYNTTPGENEEDTWVAATGVLNFVGEFSKSSAVSGGFAGTTTIGGVGLGGTWIAAKETMGAGILKP